MENRYEALKKALSSFTFDSMLNNTVALCEHCALCNEVDVKVKNEPWFNFFCYQFVRNIETLYNIIYLDYSLKEKRCNTLTYWIHDKITNYYDKPNINMKNVDIFSEILNVWKNINSRKYKNDKYTCTIPVKEEPKNLVEMKRKKIMSDYCENYYTIKSLLTRNVHVNCHIYYDYFKDSFLEFSENIQGHEEECLGISNCHHFCRNHDPDDLLNNSKCKVIEISNDKKEYIKQEDCEKLKTQAVSEVKCETNQIKVSEFTFSDNRAIILILFSLWGIFLSFLFLYK
ncbi:PIR Superfamily Protein, partial [Plasmodium ovale curtisi]